MLIQSNAAERTRRAISPHQGFGLYEMNQKHKTKLFYYRVRPPNSGSPSMRSKNFSKKARPLTDLERSLQQPEQKLPIFSSPVELRKGRAVQYSSKGPKSQSTAEANVPRGTITGCPLKTEDPIA